MLLTLPCRGLLLLAGAGLRSASSSSDGEFLSDKNPHGTRQDNHKISDHDQRIMQSGDSGVVNGRSQDGASILLPDNSRSYLSPDQRPPVSDPEWTCPEEFPSPPFTRDRLKEQFPDGSEQFVLTIPEGAAAREEGARARKEQRLVFRQDGFPSSWRLASVLSESGAAENVEEFGIRVGFSVRPPTTYVPFSSLFLFSIYTKSTSGAPKQGPEVSGGEILKALTKCAVAKDFQITLTDESNLTALFIWKDGMTFYMKYGFRTSPQTKELCGPTFRIAPGEFWRAALCTSAGEFGALYISELYAKKSEDLSSFEREFTEAFTATEFLPDYVTMSVTTPKQVSQEQLDRSHEWCAGGNGGIGELDGDEKSVVEIFQDLGVATARKTDPSPDFEQARKTGEGFMTLDVWKHFLTRSGGLPDKLGCVVPMPHTFRPRPVDEPKPAAKEETASAVAAAVPIGLPIAAHGNSPAPEEGTVAVKSVWSRLSSWFCNKREERRSLRGHNAGPSRVIPSDSEDEDDCW